MESNIISFKRKKKEYDGCKHNTVVVDPELFQLECSDCGALLDPMQYLLKLANRESSLEYRITNLAEHLDKMEKRVRTKCIHCGQMTPISQ